MHHDRCFPLDSGFLEFIGKGDAAHTNLNIPLPPGSGHGAFERAVIPALERFRPELIVTASGLDANAMDPIGRVLATSET